MTTKVTVEAIGWDVRVAAKDTKTKKNVAKSQKVSKNTTSDFYIFDSQFLVITEIQPRKPRTKKTVA